MSEKVNVRWAINLLRLLWRSAWILIFSKNRLLRIITYR